VRLLEADAGQAPGLLCLRRAREPLSGVLAELGRRGCDAQGWAHAGELLEVGPGCTTRSAALPAMLRLVLGRPLDINSADETELEALPRIGPVLARRIVEARRRGGPFATLGDLRRVRGIGPATLRRLAPLINLEVPREPRHE
jgi:hypothetical protein